eukprot:6463238-Amphidinium_carterae.1
MERRPQGIARPRPKPLQATSAESSTQQCDCTCACQGLEHTRIGVGHYKKVNNNIMVEYYKKRLEDAGRAGIQTQVVSAKCLSPNASNNKLG